MITDTCECKKKCLATSYTFGQKKHLLNLQEIASFLQKDITLQRSELE